MANGFHTLATGGHANNTHKIDAMPMIHGNGNRKKEAAFIVVKNVTQ